MRGWNVVQLPRDKARYGLTYITLCDVHLAEHSENRKASVKASHTVKNGHQKSVPQHVVLELVEARHGNKSARACRKSKKHLNSLVYFVILLLCVKNVENK